MKPNGLIVLKRRNLNNTISNHYYYLYSDHQGYRIIYSHQYINHPELLNYINYGIKQMIAQSFIKILEDFHYNPSRAWQFEDYLTI